MHEGRWRLANLQMLQSQAHTNNLPGIVVLSSADTSRMQAFNCTKGGRQLTHKGSKRTRHGGAFQRGHLMLQDLDQHQQRCLYRSQLVWHGLQEVEVVAGCYLNRQVGSPGSQCQAAPPTRSYGMACKWSQHFGRRQLQAGCRTTGGLRRGQWGPATATVF